MKVIGLLSWYEEDPSLLTECVNAAAQACDHLIAVDGAYALYPTATHQPYSDYEQYRAIHHAARAAGIGATTYTQPTPWRGRWGGEVAKRDFMLRVGMQIARPNVDWFFRIDADEIVTKVPVDFRERLEETRLDVASVMMWSRGHDSIPETQYDFRCLYRAIPGIRVTRAHYIVAAPGRTGLHPWRILTGDDHLHPLAAPADLLDLRLEHRTDRRGVHRKKRKLEYLTDLLASGLETVPAPCFNCKNPDADPVVNALPGINLCITCRIGTGDDGDGDMEDGLDGA